MSRCGKTGKVRHASRNHALMARRTVLETKGYTLKAYLCPHCKGWHLGNNRGTREANLQRTLDRLKEERRGS